MKSMSALEPVDLDAVTGGLFWIPLGITIVIVGGGVLSYKASKKCLDRGGTPLIGVGVPYCGCIEKKAPR